MAEPVYWGVTIDNLRQAFYYLYYGKNYPREEAMKFILPMQNNFFSPIEAASDDTYILVTYTTDDSITTDANSPATNYTIKRAECSVRFVGAQAEIWAKALHHMRSRPAFYKIWLGTCQAEFLKYIGAINTMPVSFFGKNFNTAFDIDFYLEYKESIDLGWLPLENVSVAPGNI